MVTIVNQARARLEAGEISVGLGIRLARTSDIATMMKTAGMDWLFIDLEHGPLTLDQTAQISVAALSAGIAPLVRVPKGEMAMATRALDGGALGIVMPSCESADEAREIVDRLHYPPEGHRSVVGGLPQIGFGGAPMGEVAKAMNDAMLVIVMLETPNAIANADEIAAVEGIDVVMIGPTTCPRHPEFRARSGMNASLRTTRPWPPPAGSTASGWAWAASRPRNCRKNTFPWGSASSSRART